MLLGPAALRRAPRLGHLLPPAAAAAQGQLRQKFVAAASGGVPAPVLRGWYRLFGHSSIGYATWLVGGILVSEGLTGWIGDGVWNSVNEGRTFGTVDWTKFKTDDDDDDEDEDDDDEEGDDEEGGDDDDD